MWLLGDVPQASHGHTPSTHSSSQGPVLGSSPCGFLSSANTKCLWIGSSAGLFIFNLVNFELEAVLHYKGGVPAYVLVWKRTCTRGEDPSAVCSYVLPTSPLYFIIVEEESTKPASQKQSGVAIHGPAARGL
ncbi:WD repeat-containing protein 27 [Manis javanica]|nr:WD repeat-containing protein 27 [Manis javanica]